MLTRGLSFHVADSKWAFKAFWGLTGTQYLPIQHVQTHRNQPLKGFQNGMELSFYFGGYPLLFLLSLCCRPIIPNSCPGQDLQG